MTLRLSYILKNSNVYCFYCLTSSCAAQELKLSFNIKMWLRLVIFPIHKFRRREPHDGLYAGVVTPEFRIMLDQGMAIAHIHSKVHMLQSMPVELPVHHVIEEIVYDRA